MVLANIKAQVSPGDLDQYDQLVGLALKSGGADDVPGGEGGDAFQRRAHEVQKEHAKIEKEQREEKVEVVELIQQVVVHGHFQIRPALQTTQCLEE